MLPVSGWHLSLAVANPQCADLEHLRAVEAGKVRRAEFRGPPTAQSEARVSEMPVRQRMQGLLAGAGRRAVVGAIRSRRRRGCFTRVGCPLPSLGRADLSEPPSASGPSRGAVLSFSDDDAAVSGPVRGLGGLGRRDPPLASERQKWI